MSVQGDIATWIEERLTEQVSVLNDVRAIGGPEEFARTGRHPPSAGIVLLRGDEVDGEITLGEDGEQLITLDVHIYVSAKAFRGGVDLTNDSGLYELFDLIHAALKNETPTSAFTPLRYVVHESEIVGDGLAVMAIQYETSVII